MKIFQIIGVIVVIGVIGFLVALIWAQSTGKYPYKNFESLGEEANLEYKKKQLDYYEKTGVYNADI